MTTHKQLMKTIKALQSRVRELRAENRALKSAMGHAAIAQLERITKGKSECKNQNSNPPFPFHL